jgi:hypothetical protein
MEEYIRTHQAARPLVTPLQKAIAAGITADPTGASLQILTSPSATLRSPHSS